MTAIGYVTKNENGYKGQLKTGPTARSANLRWVLILQPFGAWSVGAAPLVALNYRAFGGSR
jgi:hypothetical protein